MKYKNAKMHRVHSGFTVAVPIKIGQISNLRSLLKDMDKSPSVFGLDFASSYTTLFVSGVILPEQNYCGESLPATFVFATTYSGPLENHLMDLLMTSGKGLFKIFSHCINFPKGTNVKSSDLINYLRSNSYKGVFNSRYNCFTKDDIENEKLLRHDIENYIDKAQSLKAFEQLSAIEIKTLIQRFIKVQQDKFEWSFKPDKRTLEEIAIINRGPIAGSVTLGLLLTLLYRRPKYFKYIFGTAFTFSILFLATLYHITKKGSVTAVRPQDKRVREIGATQLHPIINEITASAPLKEGIIRKYFYSAALRFINAFAPVILKIPTVSSIRWLTIDNKKRLVFLSNFSNTTDFYVRDFLTGSTPLGVNFMFTNGQGFPDAKLLVYGGITKDPEGYMDAVHQGQQITDLWYSHDPMLTADVIIKNRQIRNGLFASMTEEKAKEWLRLL